MNELPVEIFSKIALFTLIDNDGYVMFRNLRGLHLSRKFREHLKGLLASLLYVSITETSITVTEKARPGQKLRLNESLLLSLMA